MNPHKEIQDRCLVFNTDGISVTCRATDYKDPIKILVAPVSGVYCDFTTPFQRGPLNDLSRTLTAQKNDAGVMFFE